MARIEPRKNKQGEIISYRIRVYRGYDDEGHKLKPFETTWKVPEGWTEKRIQKELQKVAADFENRCQQGEVCSEQDMKLSKFCGMYLDLVKNSLAPRTLEAYTDYINKLIIPALGHMKLSEIKPVHVQRFVQMLAETPKPNGKLPSAAYRLASSSSPDFAVVEISGIRIVCGRSSRSSWTKMSAPLWDTRSKATRVFPASAELSMVKARST